MTSIVPVSFEVTLETNTDPNSAADARVVLIFVKP